MLIYYVLQGKRVTANTEKLDDQEACVSSKWKSLSRLVVRKHNVMEKMGNGENLPDTEPMTLDMEHHGFTGIY